jgi:plastocyanin
MRRLPLAIAAGALVLAAPLAACGGGDDSSSSSTAPSSSGSASTLTVHAQNALKFDKAEYTAKAGKIDVSYVNDGNVGHTLLIKKVSGFKLSIGSKDDGTVDLKAGTYTLYCDIAGHEAAGMEATLTVS